MGLVGGPCCLLDRRGCVSFAFCTFVVVTQHVAVVQSIRMIMITYNRHTNTNTHTRTQKHTQKHTHAQQAQHYNSESFPSLYAIVTLIPSFNNNSR